MPSTPYKRTLKRLTPDSSLNAILKVFLRSPEFKQMTMARKSAFKKAMGFMFMPQVLRKAVGKYSIKDATPEILRSTYRVLLLKDRYVADVCMRAIKTVLLWAKTQGLPADHLLDDFPRLVPREVLKNRKLISQELLLKVIKRLLEDADSRSLGLYYWYLYETNIKETGKTARITWDELNTKILSSSLIGVLKQHKEEFGFQPYVFCVLDKRINKIIPLTPAKIQLIRNRFISDIEGYEDVNVGNIGVRAIVDLIESGLDFSMITKISKLKKETITPYLKFVDISKVKSLEEAREIKAKEFLEALSLKEDPLNG